MLVGSILVRSDRSRTPASLWDIYEESLKGAKYVDLTHTINPSIPVWHGFGPSKFAPTVDPARNQPYTYEKDGFEATHYDLSIDQLGTQLSSPRSLESLLSCHRRTAGNLHDPAARGDPDPCDRPQRFRLPDDRGRHPHLGAAQWENPRGGSCLYPIGLVQGMAKPGVGRQEGISRRCSLR